MKKNLLSIAFVIIAITTAFSQTQLRKWYIAPNTADVQTASVSFTANLTGNAKQVTNGVYDNNTNLLFYVEDNIVHRANGTTMGTLQIFSPSINYTTAEVTICIIHSFSLSLVD